MSEGAQDIQFWEVRKRANRKKPWELRWRIDTVEKSRSFLTKELAANHKTALHRAARAGERFSTVTGEPESWAASRESVWSLLRDFVRHAWAHTSSGNTRRTIADNVARLALASLDDAALKRYPSPAPAWRVRKAVHAALAFRIDAGAEKAQDRVVPPDPASLSELDRQCLAWLERVCLPVSDAGSEKGARQVLDRSAMRADGKGRVAGDTLRRRRGIWSNALDHAVARGLIAANPIAGVRMRRARSADAVNPRTVPDYEQASRLIRALMDSERERDGYLSVFFATAYLAGTRPGETRGIRAQDIVWPEDVRDPEAVPGWGVLMASGSRSEVAGRYTDDGAHGEDRELKQRASDDVRPVPLCPELVALLRGHLARYGTAPDGRLWWHASPHGEHDVFPGKLYRAAWSRAREAALTPSELSLGVASRPYDLRHGCASWLLYTGVPAPEVARRLGHTVEVLMQTYAHWFTGQTNAANARIDTALEKAGPLTGHRDENTTPDEH